ncbi:myelin-associated glycoprotein-like [Myxocyprinus asiaticus]|uniref:myelin-associated glycoprotein-like n=1 Tax=Myxocyprinus asiaticus TaxID=70543 RepID=UPI0022228085|nr:myelin-associated glycoprotein-like [Myxocyprinus asiaticus]
MLSEVSRPFAFVQQLRNACRRWVLAEETSDIGGIIVLVVLEQFIGKLPIGTMEWDQCHQSASLDEAVQLAEDHLAAYPGAGGGSCHHWCGREVWASQLELRGAGTRPRTVPSDGGGDGVWCNVWFISLPEKIEALNGCSVIIKCTFEINNTLDKDLTESATGVWYKDGHDKEKIAFNSSIANPNPIIRGNLSGKLHEKNCTTIFYDVSSNHNGKYYFRIEGNGGLKYTYTTASVAINVIESPHNLTVKLYVYQKEVQSQQEVLEGSSVSLSCSAETLCSSPPATLTWSSTPRLPFSLQEQQNQTELISHLNFTATHLQHTITFTCTVTYQLQDDNKTAHSNLTLHVTYAPKIPLSSSCNRTDVTMCLCEVDGNPSPKLVWHLSGRPVSNSTNSSINEERLSSTVLRSFITLHHSLTHTSTVQCVTTNTHGNDSKEFQLKAVSKDEKESVYANKEMLSPGGATTLNCPESLHYSSIDVTKTNPESEKFRGISFTQH